MSAGCLALNASFEPLTMVPVRRALRLLIDGKAEIVEAETGRVVRSERMTLPRPAVIRLTRFIHVPRKFRRQVTNTFLFARDDYTCQYCGRHQMALKPRESLTRDHVIPLSRGGLNDWTNVVTACAACKSGATSIVRFPYERGRRLRTSSSRAKVIGEAARVCGGRARHSWGASGVRRGRIHPGLGADSATESGRPRLRRPGAL